MFHKKTATEKLIDRFARIANGSPNQVFAKEDEHLKSKTICFHSSSLIFDYPLLTFTEYAILSCECSCAKRILLLSKDKVLIVVGAPQDHQKGPEI